jgi:hypothetical protein
VTLKPVEPSDRTIDGAAAAVPKACTKKRIGVTRIVFFCCTPTERKSLQAQDLAPATKSDYIAKMIS